MKIYDEALKNELENPDLEKGHLESARRLVKHHPEQKLETHREVMAGTITPGRPEGLKHIVVDKPYVAAWDEYEDVQVYIPYTQEELDKIAEEKAAEEEAQKAALEAQAEEAKRQAETAERIARIDVIDAQVTYTALMTDTLIDESGSSDSEDAASDAADSAKTETEA